MAAPVTPPPLDALREKIRRMEGRLGHRKAAAPLGVPEIDQKLPGGGLPLGALHEVAGGGDDAVNAAVAARFSAGLAALTGGQVLWIAKKADLFAPSLQQAGLPPTRVVFVEVESDADGLACFEEGLRHGGLSAVVAEVGRLTMTASRRLQLAAESGGALGIAIRRWPRLANGADFGKPTASSTRWRVSAMPSAELPVQGVGQSRWLLELIRTRSGESGVFEVEAGDGPAGLRIAGAPTPPAHRIGVVAALGY
ncbi:ImuA family protein [Acetobacter sp. DsW_063]|uniref:ImuA family protein n=1 Tax=Acetobacter sp. DsW_063 TaxID=1514894 RepID=UPI000B6A4B50|nr:damage-inducible protein [Acetobacter sp. DsW_063]OUJ14728.1 damage-inducible protein [Acetobacter sp. DsW_063]